jgi:hypothetical protein
LSAGPQNGHRQRVHARHDAPGPQLTSAGGIPPSPDPGRRLRRALSGCFGAHVKCVNCRNVLGLSFRRRGDTGFECHAVVLVAAGLCLHCCTPGATLPRRLRLVARHLGGRRRAGGITGTAEHSRISGRSSPWRHEVLLLLPQPANTTCCSLLTAATCAGYGSTAVAV